MYPKKFIKLARENQIFQTKITFYNYWKKTIFQKKKFLYLTKNLISYARAKKFQNMNTALLFYILVKITKQRVKRELFALLT